MATTLKVKNQFGEAVTIKLDAGPETVEVADEAEAELEERFLRSASFQQHADKGRLRIVLTQNPSDDQYKLARRIMPVLLRNSGTRIVSLYGLVERSVKAMQGLRDDYNDSHDDTKASLSGAKEDAGVADNMSKSLEHFLNLKIEQKDLADAQQAVTDLENEDTSAAGFDLADWFRRRQTAEGLLQAAQRRLDAAQKIFDARYKVPIQKLKDAAQTFAQVDPATDIGNKLPSF